MRTTRSLAISILISASTLTGALAVTHEVHAQGADDPSTKAARERFKEGVGLYEKGQFEQARTSFKQAYALKAHY